ncbi:MAG: Ig-like domain-containing protein, partial [Acidimicrobiia bacterium]|nr:Ig-like domain-containing protein [Acidimicrobiia bacterium]
TDTATIVVQLANTPDAPVADDDGYVTPKNTQLAVPAPLGVLGNDVDVDPGALTASIDTPPAVGAVALAGDGSFTFDPPPGFTGRTSFTYRATGAAGSDVATVDILVDSGVGTPTVYLGQTGPDPEHYDFLFSPPAPADPEPDVDMDGYGGHTLVDAGVPGTGGDPARSQSWVLELPNFGELDGPGHLDVWSQVRDTAAMGPDAMLRAEVYECAPDLTGCVRFAEASAYDENWSSGWASRVINLGHITRSLTPGNVVKLYVESSHADLLVAASGTRPSRLVGTSPNQAPEVADIDLTGPAGILEGATVVIDLAAATTDIDIVPGLTAVTAGPSNGQIVDNGDGTVSYTPDPGFSGDDQFDFELTDSNGQTGSATVFIQVIDTNGQPYMTEPEGALTVWTPDATGEVRPNGNWRIVFDVEPGYQTGVQVGQYFVQGPIILTIGGMTAGDNEWGEDLSLVIDSVSDPDGVIDWMSGFILKPGDWYGFYYASDYTHFVDFATTDNEGTAVVKLRLDDGNATNNLSDDLIVIRIKNYD